MTAVALLHPDVSPQVVECFKGCADIRIQKRLEGEKSCSAALIFGGDGTVHRHLRQLHQCKIPTLVVPAGSGNDFAKALGIFSVDDALKAWKQFCAGANNVREIDLGVIRPGKDAGGNDVNESDYKASPESGSNASPGSSSKASPKPHSASPPSNPGSYFEVGDGEILFCCVAGIGMDAEANALANRMPAWLKGRGGYLLAALRSLMAFAPAEIRVTTTEGREIRRSAFFVAVGNAHRYGGGMKITPRAAPDDGLLDICYVGRMRKLKLLCWLPTIFFGRHLGLAGLEYFQAETVRIETGRVLKVYADGDWACRTPVEMRVLARALRVIGPAGKTGC